MCFIPTKILITLESGDWSTQCNPYSWRRRFCRFWRIGFAIDGGRLFWLVCISWGIRRRCWNFDFLRIHPAWFRNNLCRFLTCCKVSNRALFWSATHRPVIRGWYHSGKFRNSNTYLSLKVFVRSWLLSLNSVESFRKSLSRFFGGVGFAAFER